MIKSKKLMLTLSAVLLATLAVMMVSAAVSYTSVIGSTQSVNPGSQVTISFNLKEDGNGVITNLAFDSPLILSGCSSDLEVTPTITGKPSTLAQGATSGTVTLTFNVPQNQPSCDSYTGNLNLRGQYINDVGPYILPLSIKVNAKPSLSVTEPTIISPSQSSKFTITNNGNVDLPITITIDSITHNGGTLTFIASPNNPTILKGQSQEITVTSTIPGGDESLLAGKTTKVKVAAAEITTIEKILKVEGSYCEAGDVGTLEIKKVDFSNEGPIGDDDEWYMFDKINVEVTVRNTGDERVKDVIVEWGLYDKSSGEFLFDEKENDFDLDEKGEKDDEEKITLSFTLDPSDFGEDFSEGDFAFILKAYSDDEGEDVHCASETENDFDVKKEDDYVVVKDIRFLSDTIPCNQLLEGEFSVWNIGGDDQENLYITVENQELGIDEKYEIGDLKVSDDKKVKFSAKISSSAIEKPYALKVTVHEEDGDIFENGDDNDEAEFTSPLFNVLGNCISSTIDAEITAILDSETPDAIAGKQIIVRTTLRNRGDKEATYTISVEGNSAWSNLVAIDPQVLTIPAGESKTTNIILSINSDAEGSKEFIIKATSDERTKTQPFGVTVTRTSGQTNQVTEHLRENWFIYLIIVVNIILIIAIIIVIRRMVAPVPM